MRENLRVLILRAPELSLKVLERDLAEAGFDLLVGTDLHQTRKVLQETSDIDVVLTDSVLPWGTWPHALDTVEELARIFHKKSAARRDQPMSTSLHSLVVLTVLFKYASARKLRAPCMHGLLTPLASTPCEISGLGRKLNPDG